MQVQIHRQQSCLLPLRDNVNMHQSCPLPKCQTEMTSQYRRKRYATIRHNTEMTSQYRRDKQREFISRRHRRLSAGLLEFLVHIYWQQGFQLPPKFEETIMSAIGMKFGTHGMNVWSRATSVTGAKPYTTEQILKTPMCARRAYRPDKSDSSSHSYTFFGFATCWCISHH